MKTIVRVLGALTVLATAAPAALADEPYYPPTPYTYQAPAVDPAYPIQVAPAPAPIVVQPSYDYGWRHRLWEARRAEMRRRRWEAYRRWMWHERMEHRGFYRY